jgi:two-component system, NtrC family, nitrogen regulation response regulator NtrX
MTMPQPNPSSIDQRDIPRAPYILVVDDEPDIRQLVQEILEDEGYEVDVAENGEVARQAHRARRADLVLLDIWMPDVDGITLLKEWSEVDGLPMPVIMMSGHGTVETAVEATRLGAYDFIEKPLSLAKLLLTIEHALEADKLNRENQGLRRHSYTLEEPLGKSATMQRLREQIKRVAEHDSWVLMSSEPGCDISVAARYLHRHSLHRDRPFIEVHVGSLSGDNSAHELFGSEEQGKVHYGLLEQANGGTLLLHDIADMDNVTQGKLYSALESGSFQRIGANTPVELQVRIIAATHQDLTAMVDKGRLRKDLFFLLNVVPIQIPALREHVEDVPEILNFFTNLYVEHEKLPYRKFSTGAQNRLRNYHWPGNVRELMNLVQRLLIAGDGSEISLEEVEVALGSGRPEAGSKPSVFGINFDLPLREAREQFERDYLEHQLRQAGGSVGKVAKIVGLERTHLYRKLRSLGIDPKQLVSE